MNKHHSEPTLENTFRHRIKSQRTQSVEIKQSNLTKKSESNRVLNSEVTKYFEACNLEEYAAWYRTPRGPVFADHWFNGPAFRTACLFKRSMQPIIGFVIF